MKIIEITTNYTTEENCFIALGNFDGVHLAHKKILQTLVSKAKENGFESTILAFKNHTKNIINNKPQILLTSNNQKYNKLSEIGIDKCYEIAFDDKLMKLSAEEFVEDLLYNNLKVKGIVVGYDYRFGHKASGNIELLKKLTSSLGIKLFIIDEVVLEGNIISSTLIRQLIQEGEIEKANKYLGYEFNIEGKIIHGKKLGSKMGMPTANLEIDTNYVIPKFGVYDTTMEINGKSYVAATNIGKNPSIENSGIRIESHILDFEGNLYGQNVKLILHNFIRDELKFNNLYDLFNQMQKDVDLIRNSHIAKEQ